MIFNKKKVIKKVIILCFIFALSIGIAYAASDPKPVLYGQAFDGLAPADGLTVTVFPESNESDILTDIVGVTGNTGLSSYWKVNLQHLSRDVQNGDVVIIHLTDGIDETQRTYVVNLNDGAVYIGLNLDPAFQDYDEDGFTADEECNDGNPDINPNAQEVEDGIDNDCDGFTDEGTGAFDDDGDGVSENQGDCDDSDVLINPSADEDCDGVDNDCDGNTADGSDDPAIGVEITCGTGQCFSVGVTECVNGEPFDNCEPNAPAPEFCDGIDNDCDEQTDEGVQSTFYQDSDLDAFGNLDVSQTGCEQPEGFIADNSDCDDTNGGVNPGTEEICGDGIDQDCDGSDQECPFIVEIPIFVGWTSFALPYNPSGIDNSEELGQAIISSAGVNCDVIMRFDGETQLMQDDVLGLADLAFSLVWIEGYFIHCDSAGTFTYQGTSWN